MTSPAFNRALKLMRSASSIADIATTRSKAGGAAARMTKTTKTA
jgi:hypothetical protein